MLPTRDDGDISTSMSHGHARLSFVRRIEDTYRDIRQELRLLS